MKIPDTSELGVSEIQWAWWCRGRFDSLADGGIWAIPRSGLIFQRQGDDLVMIDKMPYDPSLPVTAQELREQQNEEFEVNRRHFKAAGITLIDKT